MVTLQFKTLAVALMGMLVFFPIPLWFVLGSQDDALAMPSPLLLAAPVVAGVVVHVVLDAIGYRTAAISPTASTEETQRIAASHFGSAMIRRFAFGEVIAVVCIALGFIVTTGGYLLVLVGCATSMVLMLVHVWPGQRPVTKTAASLEREGARSGLSEAFGLESRTGGAIQEL